MKQDKDNLISVTGASAQSTTDMIDEIEPEVNTFPLRAISQSGQADNGLDHDANADAESEPLVADRQYHTLSDDASVNLAVAGENNDAINPVLTQLNQVEQSPWRYRLRWAYLDNFIERHLQSLVIGREAIFQQDPNAKYYCSDRVWLSGRSILIQDKLTRQKVLGIRSGLQGIEEILFTTMHAFFLGVLGTHLYYLGQTGRFDFTRFWQALTDIDNNGLVNLTQTLAQLPSIYLQLALASPVIWGGFRSLITVVRGALPSRASLVERIEATKPYWGKNLIGSELVQWVPIFSARSRLQSLARTLQWNANLTQADRETIFNHIQQTALMQHKKLQRDAMQALAKIAHSYHIKDLDHLKELGYTDEDIEALQALKTRGLETLQPLAQFRPQNQRRRMGYVKQSLRVLYASYLLWWLGKSTSLKVNLFFWAYKLAKLALQIIFMINFINTLRNALACPKPPGFQFGEGLADFSADYTVECFQKRIQFFRTLNPKENVTALVRELQNYYLVGLEILNLASKALTWQEVKEIIHAVIIRGAEIVELYLENNFLGDIPDDVFSMLPDLKILVLDNNYIVNISYNTFKILPKLQQLSLINNKIEEMTADIFYGLSKLEILDLGSNQFKRLRRGFCLFLKNIKSLSLDSNRIKSINIECINKLKKLELLDLGSNHLKEFSGNVSVHLPSLLTLYLGGNKLSNIKPSTFENLPRLRKLDLSFNKISEICSKVFLRLTELQVLYLNHNKFMNAYNATWALPPNLKEIDLSRCHFREFPSQILENLSYLQVLRMDGNPIDSLPVEFPKNLKSLRLLSLAGTKIKELRAYDFSRLEGLQELDLAANQLTGLSPQALAGLFRLRVLRLGGTGIRNLSSQIFSDLLELRLLNLGGNNLHSVPIDALTKLAKLEELSLAVNPISTIPEHAFKRMYGLRSLRLGDIGLTNLESGFLKHLVNVTYLDFSINLLSVISPKMFSSLPKLQSLFLGNNKLSHLPAGTFLDLPLVSLDLSLNQLPDEAFYNLSQSLPSVINTLYLDNSHLTNVGLKYLEAILPCTNLTKISSQGNPINDTQSLDITLLLKQLQKFCESQRCQGVWPNAKGECHLPPPPNIKALQSFRTVTNEPPCFYQSGGTNLVLTEKQPNLDDALLPECQLRQLNQMAFLTRLSWTVMSVGILAGATEMPRELLKMIYPKNKIAKVVQSSLLVAPMLGAAYIENSCRAPVVSVSSMVTFTALKTIGASNKMAYVGMLCVATILGLWFLAPKSFSEAQEALVLFAIGLGADALMRHTARKTTQLSIGFFKSAPPLNPVEMTQLNHNYPSCS